MTAFTSGQVLEILRGAGLTWPGLLQLLHEYRRIAAEEPAGAHMQADKVLLLALCLIALGDQPAPDTVLELVDAYLQVPRRCA